MRVVICVAVCAGRWRCAGERSKRAIGKEVGNSPLEWLGQTTGEDDERTRRMATSAMVAVEKTSPFLVEISLAFGFVFFLT